MSLLRGPHSTPEVRYMDFVYLRIDDPDGEVRVVAHGIDITEQVVAANELRDTQERLRDQFAKLPVPTFLWEVCDDDFVLIDYNEAAIPLVEPLWPDAIGRRASQLFPNGWPVQADARTSLSEGRVIRRTFVFEVADGAEPRTFDLTDRAAAPRPRAHPRHRHHRADAARESAATGAEDGRRGPTRRWRRARLQQSPHRD